MSMSYLKQDSQGYFPHLITSLNELWLTAAGFHKKCIYDSKYGN